MAHARTQLRQATKSALDDGLSGDNYRIFASRKSAINHDPSKALVDMRFSNDQTRAEEVMNYAGTGDGARIHVASLYIRVQRSAHEEQLDDILDQDEVNIVRAMEEYDWDDLLEEEPELIQVNFIDDGSTGNIMGGLVLRFDLEYRINRSDPETIIE